MGRQDMKLEARACAHLSRPVLGYNTIVYIYLELQQVDSPPLDYVIPSSGR